MTDMLGRDHKADANSLDEAALVEAVEATPAGLAATTVVPGPGNVIVLPANAVIAEVIADGRDLIIVLEDGSRILVPDGAIVLPQLQIGDTNVPPANLAALLVGNEPEPAAGAPQSSGGNFATDPGDIQSAFDIGDLLPYTELSRPVVEEREIIPAVDQEPEIDIEVDDSGVRVINAEDVVDEAGLPARGEEPEGTQAATDAETTYGFINFNSPDGVGSIAINGVVITSVGQTFSTDLGRLVITSIEAGRIGYDYILEDNSLGADADFFEVVISDADGDSATATLRIDIVDDGPIGVDDVGNVPPASHEPIEGNVLDNDISGADDFPLGAGVTGFSNASGSAEPGETLQGIYGVLTLNADGSYSYTRDDNTPGGRSESFDYTIVDQDGTVSEATLVINIGDSPTDITFVPVIGEGTVVDEGGLPPRGDEPVGTGEGADEDPANESDQSEITGSTITFTSPDGVASVTINGVPINPNALPQTIVQNATGTLVVTGYTYDPISDLGTITYEYTLADNTAGDNTSVVFDIEVEDLDGDTHADQLEIHIIDDEPVAVADTDTVTEDGPLTASGNVITDAEANGDNGMDTTGADDASVAGVAFGTSTTPVSGSVSTPVAGTYGSIVINADGSYVYTLDNDSGLVQGLGAKESVTDTFTYTIRDGDGDLATTTITITINGDDDPVVINGLGVEGGEEVVDEDDLSDGSSPSAPALTQDGTFTLDSQDGLATLKIGTTSIYGDGVTYPVEIAGDYGLLRITGVTPVTDAAGDVVSATIAYEYVLSENTLDHDAAGQDSVFDSFTVTATDTDGSDDSATLDIKVIDDVPTANADSDSVTEDGPLVADGNVITGADLTDDNGTDGVKDVPGADGASVTGVAAGNVAGPVTGSVATEIEGLYGTLTIAANGDYTYTLDNENALVQGLDADDVLTDEVFTYTLTDGDGDTTTTTLSITINGDDDPVVINGLGVEGGEEVVDEDDLSDGSSPSTPDLTQDGTFTLHSQDGLATLKIGTTSIYGDGVTYPVEIAGDYGLLRITGVTPVTDAAGDVVSATIAYEYVLSENTLDHDAAGQDSVFDSFTVTATDTDGSDDSATLDIKVIDDVPTATDNENTVTEGSSVQGNLLTDDDGDGVDVAGADGYDGAVIEITSSNKGTSQNVVNAEGKLVIAGAFGTLTVDVATGAYSYQSNANSTNIDAQDIFTYTIRDADGDESTAELTIDVDNVAGQVSDVDVDVDEAGLPFGSDPDADTESDTDGLITVTNAVGPFKFTLTGANADGDGTYGTLVLDEDDGTYTYTLDSRFDHADGDGRNVANGAESFTYEVHDLNGNLIGSGTINVNITDDIPSVEIGTSQVDPDTLTTYDALTIDGESDTATGYVDKAFSIVTEEYGADGFGTLEVTYAMTLLADQGDDTGLDSNGVDIRIYQLDDGTIVGSTALAAPTDASDPSVIFSISVDDESGLVTLVQNAEIDHPTPGANAAPYDTQLIDLPSDLVGVTATALIKDADLDTDSEDETIDLNGYVKFADDGPMIDAAVTDGDTVVLETQDADTRGTDTDTHSSTANFSAAFSIADSDYGADGAGSTSWAFSFQIENAASGLSSDGHAITLFLINDKVVGSTATDINDVTTANTIFDLSVVEATGVVTLTQYAELDHADNDDTGPSYDDQVIALANNLVNLVGVATIEDGDGDTAFEEVSLDLGGNITFADDGPALSEVALGSSVDVDETDGLPQSDTSEDPIISYVADYGADGEGSASFAISIEGDGSTSLFTALGEAITLVQDGTMSIKGVYGDDEKTAFVVTINPDGTVTLTQNVALEHDVDGDDPLTDHNDTLDLDGLINATVTLTDGDFDETSAPIAIGSALVFYDDGPSVTLSGVADSLTVSDADFASDDSESFADAFTFDGGEDGTADTSYALSVTDGDFSGLVDTLTGKQVFLFIDGDDVVGLFGTDAADAAANGDEVFRVIVDTDGNVELDQSRAVNHTINGGNGTSVSLISDDVIKLVATITDNDGDTASTSLGIGSNLSFTDDVPTAETTLTAYLDDDALGGNVDGPNDQDPDTDNLTGSLVDDVQGFGNDGGTVAFALTGAPTGFRYVSDGADGVNIQQEQGTDNWVTVVHVTLDPTNGNYSVSQTANIWHTDDGANDENDQTFTLDATLTDGDGDTVPASLTIVVDDDTPIANAATSSGTVDEDGLTSPYQGIDDNGTNDVTGAATVANGFVTGLFTAGADTPLTYGLDDTSTAALEALDLSSNGDDLTYTIVGDTITASTAIGDVEVFTFTLDPDSGEWTFTLKAPLDHADTNDSENATDIVIEFASLIYATDEDGDRVNADAEASVAVTVDDDTPRANDDTDSVTEDTVSTDGDVITGNGTTSGAAGADESGADGFGDPIVTAISGFNGAVGTVGGNTAGEFGTLELNADGTYTYSPDTADLQFLDSGETRTDTFTYTIVDADGDEVTATLEITINGANDAPVANPDTNWIVEDGASPITGNVITGATHNGAPDSVNRADVADTDVDVETLTVAATDTGTFNGTYGVLTLNTSGSYSYRLYTQAENPTAYAAVQALKEGDTPLTDTFDYNATDGTAESNETSLTISIFGSNDAPVVGTASVATSDEGFTYGNKDGTGTPTDSTDLRTAGGTISITDADANTVFTVTLAIPTETLAVADGSATGAAISWSLTDGGKTLEGRTAGGVLAIEVKIDDDGNFTVKQSLPIFHPNTTVEDVKTFTVDVNVNDGTTTVTKTDAITVNLEDDSPEFVSKTSAYVDPAGDPDTFVGQFNYEIGGDKDVTQDATQREILLNDFSGKVGTGTISNTHVSSATVVGNTISYTITFDYAPNPANPGETEETSALVIFDTVSKEYSVELLTPIQSYEVGSVNNSTITFYDTAADPYGGASQFEVADADFGDGFHVQLTGIRDTSASPLSATGDNGFQDGDLFTGPAGYLNVSSDGIGVNGNTLQPGELVDMTFHTTNYMGVPVATPTASATGLFIHIESPIGTTDLVVVLKLADPDNLGTVVTRALIIETSDILLTSPGGDYPALVGGQGLVVIEQADYAALVPEGYELVGAQLLTSTAGVSGSGYAFDGDIGEAAPSTSVDFDTANNTGTNDNDGIKILDIGVIRTVENTEALSLELDVTVIDADGDSFSETLYVNQAEPIVPPVVLDLDGGGNTYTPLSGGIAYDYDGDGVKTKTAWIAAGSAILAFDYNSDGVVNDASEFVFGNGEMTDLEAIAAKFDGNGDGVLDANDAAYGGFGVWIDADLDAVSDAGEFVSLRDAGITEIQLVSDGNLTVEADGDVVVYGTASYTMADGSTGEVSDAGFMLGGEIDMAMMDALLISSTQANTADSQVVVSDAELAGLVSTVLTEAAMEGLADAFAGEQLDVPTDVPARTDGFVFAGLLDSEIQGGATHTNIVSISDNSDESSMALAVIG